MLQNLLIKNIAVIEELGISLSPGLNVITGETGAGKTIIINSLELLVGGRSSADSIRSGESKARVEAQFNLTRIPELNHILEKYGLNDGDSGQLILRRHLTQGGKSTSYVNDRLVSLKKLDEIGQGLVDIHGQHQHQLLLNSDTHIDFLDILGRLTSFRQELNRLYSRWQAKQDELNLLTRQNEARDQRRQLLEFQLQDIDRARLREGEDEELKVERQKLLNSERLTEYGQFVYQNLYERKGAVLDLLAQVQDKLQQLARLDPTMKPQAETAESVRYQLQEIAMENRRYLNDVEYDPAQLQLVEDRLAEIGGLERKYGSPLARVLDCRRQIISELENIGGVDERLEILSRELKTDAGELNQLAAGLSKRRLETGRRLKKLMSCELDQLGMQKAQFCCQLNSQPIQPDIYAGDDNGIDKVEFMFSANPGEPPRPLAKVVSGGELSRIMLALKTLLAEGDRVPTLIFDEVDVGIGGSVAGIVGRKLKKLAATHQIICITHLPQIAARADQHYVVSKQLINGRMQTRVEELDYARRIEEIARMLGGENVTDTARQHAQEMLNARQSPVVSG